MEKLILLSLSLISGLGKQGIPNFQLKVSKDFFKMTMAKLKSALNYLGNTKAIYFTL